MKILSFRKTDDKGSGGAITKTSSLRFRQLISALLAVVVMLMLLPASVYAASSVQIKNDPDRTTLYSGHSYTVEYTGTSTVKFSSNNTSVLKVGSTNGRLTLVGPGKATITAKNKDTGKTSGSRTFTVKWRADSVSVPESNLSLHIGNTYQLKPTMIPNNATDVLDYSSSDSSVAKVSSGGLITAVTAGSCTITVYAKSTASAALSLSTNKTTELTVDVGTHSFNTGTDNADGATHSSTCEGCGAVLTEKHVDRDADNICDVCGASVGLTDIVTVEISWGEMMFSYQSKEWNTETHNWESTGWIPNNVNGNRITVENKGNVPVTVTYKYTRIFDTVYGSFSDGTRAITAPVELAAGETKYAYLLLTGEFTSAADTTLGTITVNIGGA